MTKEGYDKGSTIGSYIASLVLLLISYITVIFFVHYLTLLGDERQTRCQSTAHKEQEVNQKRGREKDIKAGTRTQSRRD